MTPDWPRAAALDAMRSRRKTGNPRRPVPGKPLQPAWAAHGEGPAATPRRLRTTVLSRRTRRLLPHLMVLRPPLRARSRMRFKPRRSVGRAMLARRAIHLSRCALRIVHDGQQRRRGLPQALR